MIYKGLVLLCIKKEKMRWMVMVYRKKFLAFVFFVIFRFLVSFLVFLVFFLVLFWNLCVSHGKKIMLFFCQTLQYFLLYFQLFFGSFYYFFRLYFVVFCGTYLEFMCITWKKNHVIFWSNFAVFFALFSAIFW